MALAVAIVSAARVATAEITAYEGFNYTAGSTYIGAAGGTGWSTAWGNPTVLSATNYTTVANSLTYAGLPTSGGSGQMVSTTATSAISPREFTTATSAGTLYTSVLVRKTAQTGTDRTFNLAFGDGSAAGIGNAQQGAVGPFSTTIGINQFIPTNTVYNSSPAVNVALNTTYLLVQKIEFNQSGTQERVSLFISPVSGATEPVTPNAQASWAFVTQPISAMHLFTGGGTGTQAQTVQWDELRYGTTFADVMGRAGIGLTAGAAPTIITGGTASFTGTGTNTNAGSLNMASSFTVSGGGVTAGAAGTDSITFGTPKTVSTMGTSTTIGTNAVTLQLSDTTTGANLPVSVAGSINVLNHSNADFKNVTGAATSILSNSNNTLNLNFGTVTQGAGGGSLDSFFDIFAEITSAGYTAKLDLDSISSGTGDTSTLFLLTGATTFSDVLANSIGSSYTYRFDTTTLGTFNAQYIFNLSDENLPGATNQTLTLNLQGQVVPEPSSLAVMLIGGCFLILWTRWARRKLPG